MAVDLVLALRAVSDATAAREPRLAAAFVTPRALEQLEQLIEGGRRPERNHADHRLPLRANDGARDARRSQQPGPAQDGDSAPKEPLRAAIAADRIYTMAEVNGSFPDRWTV